MNFTQFGHAMYLRRLFKYMFVVFLLSQVEQNRQNRRNRAGIDFHSCNREGLSQKQAAIEALFNHTFSLSVKLILK